MGEVYRARDSKLGRDVAIKVLPAEFARDEQRLRRFQREAKVLASLNHPNIAAIYGLEQDEDTHYLVLELVKGETLAERIARGAMAVDEALAITIKIADALEEAHERGIIHRDLKPANVMLTPDGNVKVLDFGLAKVFSAETPEADSSMSPTITRDGTRAGVILGTAAYMSPEQAKGRPVDKRADIWAFGAVLFEMVSGKKAFPGDGVSDVLAAVIKLEPEWAGLPNDASLRLRALLDRCLEKDPKQRWRDIGDVRIAIQHLGIEPAAARDIEPASASTGAMWWGVLALSALALATSAAVFLSRPTTSDSVLKTLVAVAPAIWLGESPPEDATDRGLSRTAIAFSPDGKLIVFSAGDSQGSRLYRRSLDDFEAVAMKNTEGASGPFFSPDGQWVAFWADGLLKKLPSAGGPAVTLCETSDRPPFGASWGPNNSIVFAPRSNGEIFEVSADGGEPRAITSLGEGEYAHRLPRRLPDGESLLFTVMKRRGSWEDAAVVAQSIRSGERSVLVESAADGRYLPSGHLVFLRQGTLMAMSMDLKRLEVRGGAVGILDGVHQAVNAGNADSDTGAGQWSFSASGSLAYVPGGIFPDYENALVWVDRDGVVERLPVETGRYVYPRVSPDGRRAAVTRLDGSTRDIWILDLETAAWSRLTFEQGSAPAWTPDGARVAFESNRSGQDQTYWIPADGSGAAERFATSEPPGTGPASWSPDGEILLATSRPSGGSRDIWTLRRDGEARPFIESPYQDRFPALSPDGRWVAYHSDMSGEDEVYVTPFPGPGPRIPISSGHGGTWSMEPAWSRDGRELFYVTDAGAEKVALMVVAVEASRGFSDVRPRTVFEMDNYNDTATLRDYDVTPDGRRFLMVQYVDRHRQAVTSIHLVQNWFAELERLVPTDN